MNPDGCVILITTGKSKQRRRLMNYFILITAYILDFIYKFCKDYGIALVIFTILTRIILFPLLFKITKDSKKRKLLQNEMNEIKYKYIHDKKKMLKNPSNQYF